MKQLFSIGRRTLIASVLVLLCCLAVAAPAYAGETPLTVSRLSAQDSDYSHSITEGSLTVSRLESFGGVSAGVYESGEGGYAYINYKASDGATITVTSSDTSIVSVPDNYASFVYYDYGYGDQFHCRSHKVGIAMLTISADPDGPEGPEVADTVKVPIVVYPNYLAKPVSAKKATYKTVHLQWERVEGVSGYRVMRVPLDEYGYQNGSYEAVVTLAGAQSTSVALASPWNQAYRYYIVPYMAYGGSTFSGGSTYDHTIDFMMPAAQVEWKSLAKSGAKSLKLSWSASAGASQFTILRSANENYGYKAIATTKKTAFTDKKVKKGVPYYYRIKATYPGCEAVTSESRGRMIAVKTKTAKKAISLDDVRLGSGSYWWSWTSSDYVFYYKQGSRLYAACYIGGRIKVFGFNSAMKRVSAKTVKLPAHDSWGGFYHGPDGNNYVALGYSNPKESKKKTVIKVVKYSSGWKKGKVASIKGSAGNAFEGICAPFAAGTTSFDMQGSTLYLFTCRRMFKASDGLNHQSNIAFKIDTKTMKAATDNIAYTSHSFNQRVKFRSGGIYLADHGDAYSRGICLNWRNDYGASEDSDMRAVPFVFMGETGNNSTGATMGGMEVGPRNILVCGTAQPHGYKVAGVKGWGSYKHNVYVTVTNRTTGKSTVKWLTNINPKKGKQTVGEARMVKLGDDRFAVIYSIFDDKTRKQTVHYTAIDNNGKKLLAKKYSGMAFSGGSQPLLSAGSIYWADEDAAGKTVLYRIPAL